MSGPDTAARSGTESALYDPILDTAGDGLFEIYRVLRDEHPVYYNRDRDTWCLSRYDTVAAAAQDWPTFSNVLPRAIGLRAHCLGSGDFLDTDPPRHDALRGLVKSRFTPKGIRRLEGVIDARVADVLDRLGDGPVDLARGFAWEIPFWVMCTLIGIPPESVDELSDAITMTVGRRDNGSDEVDMPGVDAVEAWLVDYFQTLVDARIRRPADDLLTDLAESVDGGEATIDEVVGIVLLLFTAGSETTAGLLGSGLMLLDAHPEQQAAVREGTVSLSSAIEEVVRFEGPVQYFSRTTTREVDLHGTRIPPAAHVALVYGAANRDERRFEDPEVFDVARTPTRHLGFGNGVHFCIGAPLARFEATIAFRRFFERVSEYHVTGPVGRMRSPIVRAPSRLPAVVTRS